MPVWPSCPLQWTQLMLESCSILIGDPIDFSKDFPSKKLEMVINLITLAILGTILSLPCWCKHTPFSLTYAVALHCLPYWKNLVSKNCSPVWTGLAALMQINLFLVLLICNRKIFRLSLHSEETIFCRGSWSAT